MANPSRRSLQLLAVTALGCTTALAGCSADVSPSPETGDGAGGIGPSAGGAPASTGSVSASSGGLTASNGRVSASGGHVAWGGAAAGGHTQGGGAGPGGMPGGGGAGGGAGGSPQGAGGSASGGQTGVSPVPEFTLQVDAPARGTTASGTVVISGWAPGFKNVEAWDPTHQAPPLGHATPAANGAFSFTVDASSLPQGATTWTIWAWDSAPGETPTHSDSVDIALTLGTGTVGAGGQSGAGGVTGTGGQGGTGGGVTGSQTIGTGSIDAPARGPAPTEAGKIGGSAFKLVKNWDFGTSGTIPNIGTLSSEFNYHDHWGTIANGNKYGAVTVAPNQATAISGQPVEDAARPYREFTAEGMKAYVRPLQVSQANVSVGAHDAGNGSITAKWTLPSGGKLLGKDLLWEARLRMPETEKGFWLAMWTAGKEWNGGAEMDVIESFGTPNVNPLGTAFHVNSVGGTDSIDYWSGWPKGLDTAGVPKGAVRDLASWHTFTWLHRTDDTFVVYYDGYVVQKGTLHWTLGGGSGAKSIDMAFLFDFGWGHTDISDVNIQLPASGFQITYEVDYSRVYLR